MEPTTIPMQLTSPIFCLRWTLALVVADIAVTSPTFDAVMVDTVVSCLTSKEDGDDIVITNQVRRFYMADLETFTKMIWRWKL